MSQWHHQVASHILNNPQYYYTTTTEHRCIYFFPTPIVISREGYTKCDLLVLPDMSNACADPRMTWNKSVMDESWYQKRNKISNDIYSFTVNLSVKERQKVDQGKMMLIKYAWNQKTIYLQLYLDGVKTIYATNHQNHHIEVNGYFVSIYLHIAR